MAGSNPDIIREEFELDPDQHPYIMLAIGRQSDDESYLPERQKHLDQKPRERKSKEEIAKFL
jgi:hypothetical protein